MKDEMITLMDDLGLNSKPVVIELDPKNNMSIYKFYEENHEIKKKYLRGIIIIVHNFVLTTKFNELVHFMEELNLFDYGNEQNQYLSIADYKNTKNLKLKYKGKTPVYFSKSSAKAIYKIFHLSLLGNSLNTILENEFDFTPFVISKILLTHKLLKKKKG
jgi:hypothetical protein